MGQPQIASGSSTTTCLATDSIFPPGRRGCVTETSPSAELELRPSIWKRWDSSPRKDGFWRKKTAGYSPRRPFCVVGVYQPGVFESLMGAHGLRPYAVRVIVRWDTSCQAEARPFKANQSCFYYFSGVLTMCAILLQPPGKSRYGYRKYTRIGMVWLAKVHTNKLQKSGSVATLVLV